MFKNIHPLWIICLVVRSIYIIGLNKAFESKNYKLVGNFLLFVIGIGFLYKYFTGSNDEIQVNKVFWHNTRLLHGVLYLLAAYYYFNNNIRVASNVLVIDIIFSLIYRFFKKI